MKRTDMDRSTLYAINATGVPKPGYVLDAGKAPARIKVRIYWQWEGSDEDYLNPHPVFTNTRPHGNSEERTVGTADVVQTWASYCAEVKAKRAALIAEREQVVLVEQREKEDLIARIEAVRPLLDLPVAEGHAYIDSSDLLHAARFDRMHDTRYSAMHVLRLVEAIMATAADR